MPRRQWVLAVAAAALVAVAGACGGDSTPTATSTVVTSTATVTASVTTTASASPSATITSTATASPSATASASVTPSATASASPSATASESATPSSTPTSSATASPSASPSATGTETATAQAGNYGPPASAESIAQFPADVQPLLQGLPQGVVDLLWKVRQAGPDTLVWQDAGGEFHEGQKRAFLNEWEQITGWTINAVSAEGQANAILETQVAAGNPEWDVTEIGTYGDGIRIAAANELTPLDQSLFPSEFYAKDVLTSPDWVSVIDYGTILVYNKDTFADKPPTKVSDLWDTQAYPGKRCLYDGAEFGWNLEFALMADGVPYDQVYTTLATDAGRKQAFDKLSQIKNDTVFWSSGAESVQFILDGQCDLGTTWNGRPALRIKDEPDLPIGASWDGSLIDGDPFAIPKGAKHVDAAMSALAYALAPGNQCDLENDIAYGQIMTTAPFPDCLSDFAKEWGPQVDKIAGRVNPDFWTANGKAIEDEWAAWKTGG